ncbi:MFS transporter [Succinatimonas hippei]|uniref:MFS transporter n=1 Tax=Succinatimonas hippei TaxID=626938 RepID=UPI0023F8F6CA|nr:MFS transporter [Succinatimonas hippei]
MSKSSAHILTFISSSLAVISCFIATSMPISLMALWAKELNMSSAQLAVTMLSYFLGCIVSLLFLAKLSNALGRKKAVLCALICAFVSTIFFIDCTNVFFLNAGRFIQGIYCGIITGSAMSWAVDSAPPGKEWLGTAMSVAGASLGLMTGSLIAGIGVNFNLISADRLFEIFLGFTVFLAVLICLSKESLNTKFSVKKLITVLSPTFKLPKGKTAFFIMAAIGYIGSWGQTSFFQALSSKIALLLFNDQDNVILLTAIIYLTVTLPNAVGGFTVGGLNPAKSLKLIMPLTFIIGSMMFLTIAYPHVVIFFITLTLLSFLIGAGLSLLLKILLAGSAVTERADIISFLYFMAYVGSALPNFLIGKVFTNATFIQISFAFIVWIFLYTSAVFILNIYLSKPKKTYKKLNFKETDNT